MPLSKCPQGLNEGRSSWPCARTPLQSSDRVLIQTLCRERRELEANVEVGGQDEVLQETVHDPSPRLPHHLSALFQPLPGRWICAGTS